MVSRCPILWTLLVSKCLCLVSGVRVQVVSVSSLCFIGSVAVYNAASVVTDNA